MVQTRNLNFSYPQSLPIFNDLNFRCEKGQAISILGKSGCGKSTLLKLLGGLDQPTSGQIINNFKNVGFVFQNNALLNSFSVIDNLVLLLESLGNDLSDCINKSQSILESVGLKGTENLLPDSLSGGMQKRLGVARALVMKPELILLDEPTAGLDPVTSRQISTLINLLCPAQITTRITVTSDLFRAQELADTVFYLLNGELIYLGSSQDFMKHPLITSIQTVL